MSNARPDLQVFTSDHLQTLSGGDYSPPEPTAERVATFARLLSDALKLIRIVHSERDQYRELLLHALGTIHEQHRRLARSNDTIQRLRDELPARPKPDQKAAA